jgi:hypothetical protein
MLTAIKSWASICYRRISPFYRNPIQALPSAWFTEAPSVVLPNPHLVHDTISQLIRSNPHVEDCLRQMDGEYLLQAIVEEQIIDRGTLWVNIFQLGSTLTVVGDTTPDRIIASADAKRVCAEGWAQSGLYQFFIHVTNQGFRCYATIRPIKDDRKYATVYNPEDPIQSWTIPLDDAAMARLGFNKHFH